MNIRLAIVFLVIYSLTGCHEYQDIEQETKKTILYEIIATPLLNVSEAKINNNGTVVASTWNFDNRRTVIWHPNSDLTLVDIDAVDYRVLPTGINDYNEVIGYYDYGSQGKEGFVWDRENGIQLLVSLLPIDTYEVVPYGINNKGQISGTHDFEQPFIWQLYGFSMQQQFNEFDSLNPLTGITWHFNASTIVDINENGESAIQCNGDSIAGFGYDTSRVTSVGNLWDQNGYINIRKVTDINNNGSIVGMEISDHTLRPFRWHRYYGFRYLGKMSQYDQYGHVYAINDHEQAVGTITAEYGEQSAVLWDHSDLINLNDVVATELHIDSAYDINNRGQIIVRATNDFGTQSRLYLLDPL